MLVSSDKVIITQKQSFKYKARRYVQKLTGKAFGPLFTTKIMYRIAKGKAINLKEPTTFSEKICWYKLYYCPKRKLVVNCADKYMMRKYVEEKKLGGYLTKLIGVWDHAEEIDWDKLPDKFAIKCSHGCAYNIICLDKKKLDCERAKNTLNRWLKDDFGYYNGEPHYNLGRRRVICEEYIDSKDRLPVDYKIHCMNGEPKVIQECFDRANGKTVHYFYNTFGKALPIGKWESVGDLSIPEEHLKELMELCKTIATDFPYVRIDCYIHKGKIKLGELTFSPGAGLLGSLSEKGEIEMGTMFDLSECKKR